MKQKHLIGASMMASFAVVLAFVPALPTQWGMKLDLIAIPWMITVFLYGLFPGTLSIILSCSLLALVGPDGYVGAVMKFLATIPSIILIGIVVDRKIKKKKKQHLYLYAFLISILIRWAAMLPINYYFALPIWLGVTPKQAISDFPFYYILIPNALQSIIDYVVTWILVFKTKLRKRINDM